MHTGSIPYVEMYLVKRESTSTIEVNLVVKILQIQIRFTQVAIDENVNRFNTAFGGINPSVTNTIFVHGELDPWRTIGRLTTLNPSSPAIVIRGGSQGNDLGLLTDEDSPQLVEAKLTIMETIRQWVRDA